MQEKVNGLTASILDLALCGLIKIEDAIKKRGTS